MWEYQYQERPILTIEDATVPLPCQEVLWEAENALQWSHVRGYSVRMSNPSRLFHKFELTSYSESVPPLCHPIHLH